MGAVALGARGRRHARGRVRGVDTCRGALRPSEPGDSSSPKVPPAFDGARIVFVADIHAGPYLGRERVKSLVTR